MGWVLPIAEEGGLTTLQHREGAQRRGYWYGRRERAMGSNGLPTSVVVLNNQYFIPLRRGFCVF